MGSPVTLRLSGHGEGTLQSVTPEGSPHRISVDTYKAFGGQDSAPSPLAYALSSLTGCMQITAGIVAHDLQLTLGRFDFDLSAIFDPEVLARGSEGNPNFTAVSIDVRVETDADPEQFRSLTRETDRRCPITQLFVRSGVRLECRWEAHALASVA